MVKEIYVNLVVTDLEQTRAFWESLGFSFNPQFSDEKALCLVMGDNIYAMLILPDFFQTFTTKKIIDSQNEVEVLTAVSVESREKVDELVEKGIAAGGTETREPMDYGWMYNRALADLDGHVWEILFADASQIPVDGVTE
jgi:predicted lactoylglutathione lyase